MNYVFLGLSITSSWGNGHATTYRGLLSALAARGHRVSFLECDVPWYRDNRDLTSLPPVEIFLYRGLADLKRDHGDRIRDADAVVVGSYVPQGLEVGAWVTKHARGVTAFYDIDTPVTLAGLEQGDAQYLSRALVPRFDLYLSFTGGPTLELLEKRFGARMARPLYCAVDPQAYYPESHACEYALGYVGTYSADRQPSVDELLVGAARALPSERFLVAGPQYPEDLVWPHNVERMAHVAPREHRACYARQRFTLNVTRAAMIRSGYSPSVRLFEAAACGTPIISDCWQGLEEVLSPGREILVARQRRDVISYLHDMDERERLTLAERARARILASHTSAHRAAEFEAHVAEARGASAAQRLAALSSAEDAT
jgi:spore maturation protein CgeB